MMIQILLFPVLFWDRTVQTNTSKEYEESFEEQEKYRDFHHCNETLLAILIEGILQEFEYEMFMIKKEFWCNWEEVIWPYNAMTQNMESFTENLGCFFPNKFVETSFLKVHSQYFQDCHYQDEVFLDAPMTVVLILTLIPICLIPVLVSMVVWKSMAQDSAGKTGQ